VIKIGSANVDDFLHYIIVPNHWCVTAAAATHTQTTTTTAQVSVLKLFQWAKSLRLYLRGTKHRIRVSKTRTSIMGEQMKEWSIMWGAKVQIIFVFFLLRRPVFD
jgi:hypothetical protein